MTRPLYIVDGYNVLHALYPGVSAEELFARRDWLVDQLAGFVALRDAEAVLVFDGPGERSSSGRPIKGAPIEVCFAGGRFTADTLIARRIAGRSADQEVVVVTADQEVQRTAARAGVHRMTPLEFGGALRAGECSDDLDSPAESTTMPSRLEDKVDLETLQALQRLLFGPERSS